MPVSQLNSNSDTNIAGQNNVLPNPVNQVEQQEIKRKATYYLTEQAHKQMDELFVKGITSGKKKDKSNLICEAIELLYQKEIVATKI